jgi:hypothetical protein
MNTNEGISTPIQSTVTFKRIGLPTLCVVAITLISCASQSETASTARQTTVATTQQQQRPMQPIGYRDNNMEVGRPFPGGY